MGNTINDRINVLLDKLRINANTFSKAIGKSYTAVDGIVKGKSKPGFEFLEAILVAFPEVNPGWLLAGDGEMLKGSLNQDKETDNYLKEHLKTLEENFARLAAQLEAKDKQLEAADKRAEGLQRTVDYLISRPGVAAGANFLNGVAAGRSVVRMHPATLAFATGQVA